MTNATARHIVFLQGMPCGFFTGIAKELAEKGCRTTGINLCAGDALFYRGPRAISYRGRRRDWPSFIGRFFENEKVSDLVLLGEQRDYHKEAIAAASQLGIAVAVTDFGYFRPDWITLERDGMTGNSQFSKDAAAIARLAAACPEPDMTQRYHDSSVRMSMGDVLYSFSNVLLCWLYPHYRSSYRRPHPLLYFPFMGARMLFAGRRQKRAEEQIRILLETGKPYFLLPLQLEHDFQVVAYSGFKGQREMLDRVIRSFANNTNKDFRLVIKSHPWDPGLSSWRRTIIKLTRQYSVENRVDYIDGGSLQAMLPACAGMVTINSTSGIQAFQVGKPVLVLGQAMYAMPALTSQCSLDAFWQNSTPPVAAAVQDFVRAALGTIQIRGVFFSEPGLGDAVKSAAARIYSGTVGQPLQDGARSIR